MSYLLGCIAIVNFWLIGSSNSKYRTYGWLGGFLSQFLWAYFAISIEQYGLLGMTGLYSIVYIRGFFRAKNGKDREDREDREDIQGDSPRCSQITPETKL